MICFISLEFLRYMSKSLVPPSVVPIIPLKLSFPINTKLFNHHYYSSVKRFNFHILNNAKFNNLKKPLPKPPWLKQIIQREGLLYKSIFTKKF